MRTARLVKASRAAADSSFASPGTTTSTPAERETRGLEQIGDRAGMRREQRGGEVHQSLGDDERVGVTGAQCQARERATRDGVARGRRAVEDLLGARVEIGDEVAAA